MKLLLLIASILIISTNLAFAKYSANFAITSNYLDRGATQSDNKIALQGGFDYQAQSGFYIGTWASTLVAGAGIEQNLYFGYANSFDSIDYDISYIYFLYPNLNETDLAEINALVTFHSISVGVNYSISETEKDSETGDLYMYTTYEKELSDDKSLGITLGKQERVEVDGDEYNHAQISFNFKNWTFAYDKIFDESIDAVNGDKPVFSLTYTLDIDL